MVWQDFAITGLNIITLYALLPQVYHGFKKKVGVITLQTSILTTITLFAFALIFTTLDMILSASICTINAILWALLLIQKIKYDEHKILKGN